MNRPRTLLSAGILIIALLIGLNWVPPAQASQGNWRNINPTEYTAVPNATLNSVFMTNGGTGGVGAGDGWAVGNNGTVFRWDGFAWNNVSIGTPCKLNSVNFGSPDSVPLSAITSSAGFMVGGNNSKVVCPGPRAWFWNGNSWFNASQGLLAGGINVGNLSSVFVFQVTGSAPNYGIWAMAVGTNATAGTSYIWDGGTPGLGGAWAPEAVQGSTRCPLNAVSMVSTVEGWAVGSCGKIYHWNGGGWLNVRQYANVVFYGIYMISSTEGWAVGGNASIAHYSSGSWTCCYHPMGPPYPSLRSLVFTSSSEAWAVGDAVNGVPTLIHYSGGIWNGPLAAPLIPTMRGLRGIHGTGGSNVWAVGESGSILLYDGTNWGSLTAPLQTNFNAVWMTGSSDGAAVGNATSTGPTMARWDGVKWIRPQTSVATTDLWGVWEASSSEWWVVGGPSTSLGYAAHLTSVNSPPIGLQQFTSTCPGLSTCVLRAVAGTSSSNVWAVGDGGGFYVWDGNVWAGPVGVVGPVNSVTMLRSITFVGGDPNNGWAVGYQTTPATISPVIFQKTSIFNWQAYTQATGLGIPATVRLNTVRFWDWSHGWIGADSGWILFFDGTKWTPTFTKGTYNITAIQPVSSSEAWATGQDTSNGQPILGHFLSGFGWSWVTTHNIAFTNVGKPLSMFLNSGTDGFLVGTTVASGSNLAESLGLMFHLDPPEGGPPATTATSTSSVVTTSSSIVSSTTSSTTSSITSSSSSTSTSTSQASTTSSQTSTTSQVSSSSSSSTGSSVSTVTVTASSSSSETTPLVAPAIPGFPWESIAAGILVGLSVLIVLRRRRSASG